MRCMLLALTHSFRSVACAARVGPQAKGRPAKANGTAKRARTDRRAAQPRGVVDTGIDPNGYTAGYGNGYGNGYADAVYVPSAAGAAPVAYGGGWPATADSGVDPSLYVVRALGRRQCSAVHADLEPN